MLWVCLRFPNLPIDALFTNHGNEENKAIVVVTANKIVACNNEAEKYGIIKGMLLSAALSLYADLLVFARDPIKEKQVLYTIAMLNYDITPTIIYKLPDSILLEVRRCLKLHKSLPNILSTIENRISKRNMKVSLSVAHSVECAYLLTLVKPLDLSTYYCMQSQQLNTNRLIQSVKHVSLNELPFDNKIIVKCNNVGFTHLGDVLDLPSTELATRYGKDFVFYLQAVKGKTEYNLDYFQLKPFFDSSFDCGFGISQNTMLMMPIKRLIDDLCAYLSLRHLQCNRLEWLFGFQEHDDHEQIVYLSSMQNSKASFFMLTSIKIEKMQIPSPVISVKLRVKAFEEAKPLTPLLFDFMQQKDDKREAKQALLDKLYNRLGQDVCVKLSLTHEKLPEKAQKIEAVDKSDSNNVVLNKKPLYAKQQPLWLLPEPAPLQVRKKQLFFQGKKLTIISHSEKIDTHWWQGENKRAYYIASSNRNTFYWVFEDDKGLWWLHGIYA